MATETLLNMTPTGHYADGSPMYEFHTSFPSRRVRLLPKGSATPAEALAAAKTYVQNYERADPYGNMGEALGVAKKDGDDLYYGVVNTYHSNT